MGYKLNGEGLALGVAFRDSNGTQYPANWLQNSTDADRAAVPTGGISWISDAITYDASFHTAPGVPRDIAELKTYWLEEQKNTANSILSSSDWMVTRQAEGGTSIPSAWKTYRAAVRTQCGLREATINACADTDKLQNTIQNTLAPKIAGTASNGASEKKKEDGSSYDPVQYNDIANPDLLEDWPTEPS